VLIWWMLANLVNRRTAWLAFLVIGTTPFYFFISRQSITDMPLPRSRNWWPDWVPGGMLTRARPPSTVGTWTVPPSAAVVIRIRMKAPEALIVRTDLARRLCRASAGDRVARVRYRSPPNCQGARRR